MDKNTFTQTVRNWLEKFLRMRLTDSHEVLEVLIPESSLSKLNNEHIKSIANYSSWDFKPDVVAILQEKDTKKITLAILNRSNSALSLKEIGEINLYAKLCGAEFAFLTSLNGISSEVSLLLIEDEIRERLLEYSPNKNIIIFSWSEADNNVDSKSIVPLDAKKFLLS